MIEWNKKINLTRIVEEEDVLLKHFYDSLTLIKAVDLNKKITFCDVGSGAGFPGIVIKIVFPNVNVTLIDSLQKRINYLNQVIKELNLTEIKAIHTRAEDFKKDSNNRFDVVVARAVASLDKLEKWCLPLVKKNGIFVAMKANSEDELKNYSKAINKIIKFDLPKENIKRTLIIINRD